MHSKLRMLHGVLLALAIAFCNAALSTAHADDANAWSATQLMQALAQNKASRVTFVEKKYIAALDRPLESSGELIYLPPDRLEKRTVKPKLETLVIDKNTLTIERNGAKRSIALASYPEVAAFTESLRATLAGDLASLMRDYRVEVDGTREQWRLVLLPSDPKIAAVLSRVLVTGKRARIESIEILQADGNRSVMAIAPAAALGASVPPR